jgi:hypothetical protein
MHPFLTRNKKKSKFCITQQILFKKLESFMKIGGRVGTVVKVLCYKSEGRWFDPRLYHWKFFIDTNPSGRTMALGFAQSLTEMSTRRISWG